MLDIGYEYENEELHREDEKEDEQSNSKYDRSTYINRNVIFSDRYIEAIKSLGEDKTCTSLIIESARTMLEHHHGDKYEDLYYIESATHTVKKRTDYRVREKAVLPTATMKKMNMPDVISIHNHPTNGIMSINDYTYVKNRATNMG